MNVQEKSDCAVVPVNQPNKERLLSAEAGEERTQTKENIVQSHIRPTQSGERMSQGLRGVRQAARERKQERFTALLHQDHHGGENSVSLSQCLINRHEKFTISRKMLPSLAYKSSLYMFPPLFEAPQTTRAAGCFFESVFVEGPIQKSRLRFKLLRPLNAR
jgi:hypothetical protein